MDLEAFLIFVVAAIAIVRIAFAVTDWWRQFPVSPDPWDNTITEALKAPDCIPVCHRCLTPQEHDKWFCPECGAVVGPCINYLPYTRVFSEGEVLWNGIHHHVKRSALLLSGTSFTRCLRTTSLRPSIGIASTGT